MKDDPVVQRVREARRQIIARMGFDRRRLMEWAKQIEATRRDKVVGFTRPGKPKS